MIVLLLVVGVPSLLGIVSLGLRRRLAATSIDKRGIALQTVIIMVVLLVIAGAVAGVLISRGNEAVDDLERQDIRAAPSTFKNQLLCERAEFSWDTADDSCKAKP